MIIIKTKFVKNVNHKSESLSVLIIAKFAKNAAVEWIIIVLGLLVV